MVIFSRHPVRAALFLVLAFFSCAGLWLLLEAEFLALVLVLVYVGAVMTLFLFVVMTLNTDNTTAPHWGRYLLMGLLLTAILVAALYTILQAGHFIVPSIPISTNISNVSMLGSVLYTQYALPFELAAILLLVAIIAAISLDLREQRNRKVILPEQQILVKREERIRVIKMQPEGRAS
jgi:NADH-quinone oxidoreductase subunit J